MIGFHLPDTNRAHASQGGIGAANFVAFQTCPTNNSKKENRPVPKNRPAEPFDAQRAIVGWMIYIRTSSNSEEKLKLGTEHPLVAAVGGLPTSAGFVAGKD